ncbi:MAG TPA: hypothetical protein VN703_01480 [Candidatus Sulfopaludibacter sp.]|nr:hypothetical protein [Candidatus Sulfopaludibacter sp.]
MNLVCDKITKIIQPTLIITGTEDVAAPSPSSLLFVDKIPWAWLVQMKGTGQ